MGVDAGGINLLSPLVAALAGALIGAWSSTKLERRREARRGEALRQAVSLDLQQWQQRLDAASEWIATRPPGSGLKWWDIAGELALHTPIGLYLAIAMLYVERDGLERPYSELYGPGSGIPQGEAESAQFGFRRASMMVDEVFRLWVNYYDVKNLASAVRRVRRRSLETPNASLTTDIMKNVSYGLRKKFQYEVTDSAELISDVERGEAYAEALDSRLRDVQRAQGDDDEGPSHEARQP